MSCQTLPQPIFCHPLHWNTKLSLARRVVAHSKGLLTTPRAGQKLAIAAFVALASGAFPYTRHSGKQCRQFTTTNISTSTRIEHQPTNTNSNDDQSLCHNIPSVVHARDSLSIAKKLAVEEDDRRNESIAALFEIILEVLAQCDVSLFDRDTVRLKQLLQPTAFLSS